MFAISNRAGHSIDHFSRSGQSQLLFQTVSKCSSKEKMNYNWVPTSAHAPLPPNAVIAGNEADGSPIYVGRSHHEGDMLVAKVLSSKQVAYVSRNGMEIPKYQFDVLTGTGFTWVSSGNGQVPLNSVQSGTTVSGQPLFVGRTNYQGSLTPGKIDTSHGCLFFPYGGAEQSSLQYEVLISSVFAIHWMDWSPSQGVPPQAVVAGHDTDGSSIYVARAIHEGEQVPGKFIPGRQAMYIPWEGREIHIKGHFEVCSVPNARWVSGGNGFIPPGACPGGYTKSGETLYIGRTFYKGSLTPGKVHPSHGSLYISFEGRDISFKNYEVLVE